MWEPGRGWSVSAEPSLSIGQREGEEPFQFFGVVGALRLEDGKIVVLNGGSNTVRVFAADGSFWSEFGGSGDGPGEFRSLGAAHPLGPDTINIWDGRRPGFSVFTSSGQLVRTQTLTPPGSERLNGLEPLPDGRLLLKTYASPLTQNPGREVGIHRDSAPLILIDMDGAILDTVGIFPSSDLGIVRIAGTLGMGLVPFGRSSWIASRGVSVLVGSAEDRQWFVEQLSKRITTPEEREMFGALIEGMVFPEKKAAYNGMLVDPDKNVWLRTGRHFPPEAPSRDWTVFSPDGVLLGSLQMPERFEVFEVGSDYVLGVWKDEMEVEFIHLYHLQK